MSVMPDMNDLGLSFHHLGLAVREPEASTSFLAALGYVIGECVLDPLQNVQLMMCDHESMPSVEIIYPALGPGPLDRMLAKHQKGIVYHICYETKDLVHSLEAIERRGVHVTCIFPPTPAILFGGKCVSFYLISGVGMIEIIETHPS